LDEFGEGFLLEPALVGVQLEEDELAHARLELVLAQRPPEPHLLAADHVLALLLLVLEEGQSAGLDEPHVLDERCDHLLELHYLVARVQLLDHVHVTIPVLQDFLLDLLVARDAHALAFGPFEALVHVVRVGLVDASPVTVAVVVEVFPVAMTLTGTHLLFEVLVLHRGLAGDLRLAERTVDFVHCFEEFGLHVVVDLAEEAVLVEFGLGLGARLLSDAGFAIIRMELRLRGSPAQVHVLLLFDRVQGFDVLFLLACDLVLVSVLEFVYFGTVAIAMHIGVRARLGVDFVVFSVIHGVHLLTLVLLPDGGLERVGLCDSSPL